MTKLAGLVSIISELKAGKTNLENELRQVDAALSVLERLDGVSASAAPRRTMSAASRRRISIAQKARWAKHTASNGQASSSRPKRTMSAAARRKIAAAQRARWAKVKAKKAA
jgi:hypothetical protein